MNKIIALLLMLALLLSLCACGTSEEEIRTELIDNGWFCESTYDGNVFQRLIVFTDSNEYVKYTEKNGKPDSVEYGDFEVDGKKVLLYDSSALVHHGIVTEYRYKNHTLLNGDNVYEIYDN